VTRSASRLAPLVLVVDDFTDGRELVAEILTYAGFRTAQASTGHEALDRALSLQPDVMLLDLSLPGLDGWEIARRLRADPIGKTLRIIALTAHATPAPLSRARDAGCDVVLTKPCAPDALIQAVQLQVALSPSASQRLRAEGGPA
jgi:two-component system, cell cycle response regulator DivK